MSQAAGVYRSACQTGIVPLEFLEDAAQMQHTCNILCVSRSWAFCPRSISQLVDSELKLFAALLCQDKMMPDRRFAIPTR